MKLSRLLLVLFVFLSCAAQVASPHGLSTVVIDSAGDGNKGSGGASETISVEQARLNSIVSALKHMPAEEQQRLHLDLSKPVVEGSAEAVHLVDKWNERQRELRELMNSMLKAAEHMAGQLNQLRGHYNGTATISAADLTSVLGDLESLVSDIDNAKDFYTIGGWKIIVSLLASGTLDVPNQALTILLIGTAIKNNRDYQTWVVEEISLGFALPDGRTTVRCMELLVANLNDTYLHNKFDREYQELFRRTLYAVSAAARGNPVVQSYLYQSPFSGLALRMISSYSDLIIDIELDRKIWTFLSDLFDDKANTEADPDYAALFPRDNFLANKFCDSFDLFFVSCTYVLKLLEAVKANATPESMTVALRSTIDSWLNVFAHIISTPQMCLDKDVYSSAKHAIEQQHHNALQLVTILHAQLDQHPMADDAKRGVVEKAKKVLDTLRKISSK